MAVRTKAVIKDVKISDLKIGDKLQQDIIGQGGNILLYSGTNISHKEMLFLRRQLAAKKPRFAAERYLVDNKAPGRICMKDGTILVKPGETITEAKLAPLLKEGFQTVETNEGGILFYRKTEWPKDLDTNWHIDHFNPTVRIETTVYVNDKDEVQEDPRGDSSRVGGETSKKSKTAVAA